MGHPNNNILKKEITEVRGNKYLDLTIRYSNDVEIDLEKFIKGWTLLEFSKKDDTIILKFIKNR